MLHMYLQPNHLRNNLIRLLPLKPEDFDALFAVASDPLVWEQHPNKDRYRKEVFVLFFEDAIASRGAFLITDAQTDAVIGSSRYYQYDAEKKSVAIGYTFLSRSCWGNTYNKLLKQLMLDYAFLFVEQVVFHVGVNNFRSQKAIEKLGAYRLKENEITEPTEREDDRYTYILEKNAHINR